MRTNYITFGYFFFKDYLLLSAFSIAFGKVIRF